MPVKSDLRDNLLFIDEQTGDQVIFNYRTFYAIVKGIMMHYGGLTEIEANEKLSSSFLIQKPPVSYADVVFFTHETEYHWAMLMAYGNSYWTMNPSISSDLPDDYDEWESNFIHQNELEEFSYEYL